MQSLRMRRLAWTHDGWTDYLWWQKQDRKTLRRINTLIEETLRTPDGGIGKPEMLRGDLSGMWSRRITQEHLLVYIVTDDEVIVLSCKDRF